MTGLLIAWFCIILVFSIIAIVAKLKSDRLYADAVLEYELLRARALLGGRIYDIISKSKWN